MKVYHTSLVFLCIWLYLCHLKNTIRSNYHKVDLFIFYLRIFNGILMYAHIKTYIVPPNILLLRMLKVESRWRVLKWKNNKYFPFLWKRLCKTGAIISLFSPLFLHEKRKMPITFSSCFQNLLNYFIVTLHRGYIKMIHNK